MRNPLLKDPSAPQPPAERANFRLAVFGAVLVVVLAAAFGIGRLVDTGSGAPAQAGQQPGPEQPGPEQPGPEQPGPEQPGPEQPGPAQPSPGGHGHHAGRAAAGDTGAAPHADHAGGTAAAAAGSVGGLAVSSAGLTLAPDATTFTAGRPQPLRFRIVTADGTPVTTFAVVHDKAMHLVVVRRDLSGYQHLHPTMAADGTWSVDLTLAAAGSWRAYADFAAIVGGRQTPTTLGVDLSVAGDYRPQALPAAAREVGVAGFTVGYEGAPRVGATHPLLVRVTRRGAPAALQPYLGAYGHLVVLREGDLGYVHVHPEPRLADGAVKFWLAAPGRGRYRMYFDFQVAGAVHTAGFTMTVS